MKNKTIITLALAVMITISGSGIIIVGTFSVTSEPQAISLVDDSPGDPDPLFPIYPYSPEFLEVYTEPRYPIGYAWNDPTMTGDIITLYANVIDVDGNGVWLDYGYCDKVACYPGEDFIMGPPPWPMDLVSGTLYKYNLRGHWVAGSPSYEASSSLFSYVEFRISATNTSGGGIGYPESPFSREKFYPAWPPTSINATSSASKTGLSPGETFWVNGTANYWNSTLDPEDPSTSMPTDESDVTIRIDPGGTEFFGKTDILGNYSVLATAPVAYGFYTVNTTVTNSTPLRNVTCVSDEVQIEVVRDPTPHLPIRINSNADFDQAHGVANWATGNGTEGNPWIIEWWDINGTGYGYCIYIGNTTEYFEVISCELYEANLGDEVKSGLDLYNCANGSILNCTIKNNWGRGLFISESCNISIENCDVYSNNYEHTWGSSGNGINLESSSNNTINNCTITDHGSNSIVISKDFFSLNWSYGNIIFNNTITGARIRISSAPYTKILLNNISDFPSEEMGNSNAIDVYDSNHSIIDSNTFINVMDYVFFLASPLLTLRNNQMINSGGIMIDTEFATLDRWNTHTIDTTNTIDGKPVYYIKNQTGGSAPLGAGQVILANCTGVRVSNQTGGGGIHAVELGFSDNCEIVDNLFHEGDVYSWIATTRSDNNTIKNNTLNFGLIACIFQFDTILENNIISNGELGIYLGVAFNHTVKNNRITNTGDWGGIYVESGNNNTIEQNIITDGVKGIRIYQTSLNRVKNNTMINNSEVGIIIESSGNNNTIYHNNLLDNGGGASQAIDHGADNQWDNGYPSGGNYWNDYSGVDLNSTPAQDVPPPDGIGDLPYGILSYEIFEVQDERPYTMNGTEIPPFTFYLANGNITNSTLYLDIGGSLTRLYEWIDYRLSNWDGEVTYLDPPVAGGEFVIFYNYTGLISTEVFDNYPLMMPTYYEFLNYDISLSEGWNLVSLPLILSDESINQAISSIDNKWDCIQAYDAINDLWLSNVTSRPDSLNELQSLDHKMGFWINITEPNVNLTISGYIPTSTSIPLYAGWNLIGYPTMTNETVANALWGTGADKVEVFDPGEPYRIKEVGPTYVMRAGEGYWVHVPADSVWIVNW